LILLSTFSVHANERPDTATKRKRHTALGVLPTSALQYAIAAAEVRIRIGIKSKISHATWLRVA
jgi:hypothetical protein